MSTSHSRCFFFVISATSSSSRSCKYWGPMMETFVSDWGHHQHRAGSISFISTTDNTLCKVETESCPPWDVLLCKHQKKHFLKCYNPQYQLHQYLYFGTYLPGLMNVCDSSFIFWANICKLAAAENWAKATYRLVYKPFRLLTMATSAFLFLGRTVVSLGTSGATDLGCVSSL